MDAGYLHGVHAPGHRSIDEPPIVAHNLLRAHTAAVRALRAEGNSQLGIVVNLEPKSPATERAEDLAATARADAYTNRLFLDPLLLGRWPEELQDVFGEAWSTLAVADMRGIREPVDFLGINYYTRNVTRDSPFAPPPRAVRVRQDGALHTELDWEVHAQSLQDVLERVTSRYGRLPLFITENGAAFPDPPRTDAEVVDDPLRVAYYGDHVRAVRRAIDAGVDMRGYFAWSLLDNYEWSAGYSKRFGLYHVDFETQKRTPKASAHAYADIVRSNGGILGDR
jgi:beta-glucosidase